NTILHPPLLNCALPIALKPGLDENGGSTQRPALGSRWQGKYENGTCGLQTLSCAQIGSLNSTMAIWRIPLLS
ncbi:hypothetical protein CHS0354_007967, partial [Potamilus streckersoni]